MCLTVGHGADNERWSAEPQHVAKAIGRQQAGGASRRIVWNQRDCVAVERDEREATSHR